MDKFAPVFSDFMKRQPEGFAKTVAQKLKVSEALVSYWGSGRDKQGKKRAPTERQIYVLLELAEDARDRAALQDAWEEERSPRRVWSEITVRRGHAGVEVGPVGLAADTAARKHGPKAEPQLIALMKLIAETPWSNRLYDTLANTLTLAQPEKKQEAG